MNESHELDPFWSLIAEALADRKNKISGLAKHPVINAPRYVVELCEALLGEIHAQGNLAITLQDVAELERTCTGSDYQHKLALRCSRLASANAM